MGLRFAKYLTPLCLLFLLPDMRSAEARAQCETLLAPPSEFDVFMDEQGKIPFPKDWRLGLFVDANYLLRRADLLPMVQQTSSSRAGLSGDRWFFEAGGGDGLFTVIIKHPDADIEQRASLLFLNFLRQGGLRRARKTMGVVFKIEAAGRPSAVYTVLDFTRRSTGRSKMPTAWKNLAPDYRKLVAREYETRLRLSREAIDRLMQVSEELESRSIILAKTTEGPIPFLTNVTGLSLPDHLSIERGATLVLSRGSEEKLPLEIVTDLSIPRKAGETVAEIGRLAAKKGNVQNTTPRDAQQMAAIALGAGVDRLLIQVDAVHRRLFQKYGFKPLNSASFAGEEYSILEIETTDLLSVIIRDEFPEDSLDLASSESISKHNERLREMKKERDEFLRSLGEEPKKDRP